MAHSAKPGESKTVNVIYVIQFTYQHLPSFDGFYIKKHLHKANTETYQPQKSGVPPEKNFTVD